MELPETRRNEKRSSCLRIRTFLIIRKILDDDYAYSHPLFTQQMQIYSDSKISDFLASVTDDLRIGFLKDWHANRDYREKIYISYDSTNKNCQAGDIELVEFGHPKVDKGLPVFNYSISYDTDNRESLFYEQYSGSIVDISQLQLTL